MSDVENFIRYRDPGDEHQESCPRRCECCDAVPWAPWWMWESANPNSLTLCLCDTDECDKCEEGYHERNASQ